MAFFVFDGVKPVGLCGLGGVFSIRRSTSSSETPVAFVFDDIRTLLVTGRLILGWAEIDNVISVSIKRMNQAFCRRRMSPVEIPDSFRKRAALAHKLIITHLPAEKRKADRIFGRIGRMKHFRDAMAHGRITLHADENGEVYLHGQLKVETKVFKSPTPTQVEVDEWMYGKRIKLTELELYASELHDRYFDIMELGSETFRAIWGPVT